MTDIKKPRIKKVSNGNEYLLTKSNIWVRNFNKELVPYIDINSSFRDANFGAFYKNERENEFLNASSIDRENIELEKVIIISDGYDFKNKVQIVKDLPRDIKIIAINGALANWPLTERYPNYYLINNPYLESMKFFPRKLKSHPTCLASTKTYSEFLKNYRGVIITYNAVDEVYYKCRKSIEPVFQIDDYRNPICAAIQLAYMFNPQKIFLLGCDDSFENERPSAEKLDNGLYQYPQQRTAHELIDAKLFWIKTLVYQEINLYYNSHGLKFENATYIDEEEILNILK